MSDLTGFDEPRPNITTSNEVTRNLLVNPGSVGSEWAVAPTFTPADLQKLVLGRSEEVFFTEENGTLFVNDRESGVEDAVASLAMGIGKGLDRRIERGKLCAHTHPAKPPQGFNPWNIRKNNWLSWADIYHVMDSTNPNRRLLLFHSDGGLEYSSPKVNLSGVTNSIRRYCDDFAEHVFSTTGRRINFRPRNSGDGRISIHQLDKRQKIDFAREFTSKYDMVVSTATWEEADKMQQLIDIINSFGTSR